MDKIADKIIELRIATRRAAMCENSGGSNKNTLSLKSKFLFCLRDKKQSPYELMNSLQMGKTNLAILAKSMLGEGLIEKLAGGTDRRHIEFRITEAGREYLQKRLDTIEQAFKNILTDESEYSRAVEDIDTVLRLLSFL